MTPTPAPGTFAQAFDGKPTTLEGSCLAAQKDRHEIVQRRIAQRLALKRPPRRSAVDFLPYGNPACPVDAVDAPVCGVDADALVDVARARGFHSWRWLTMEQARSFGGAPARGETGVEVGRDGKSVTVFNLAQISGLEDYVYQPDEPFLNPDLPIPELETFIEALGADVRFAGSECGYGSGADCIRMPPFASFLSADAFYRALFRAFGTWTGAPHRLGRFASSHEMNFEQERLVAEYVSAFLCCDLGLDGGNFEAHAQRIRRLPQALWRDPEAQAIAIDHAKAAVAYVHARYEQATGEAWTLRTAGTAIAEQNVRAPASSDPANVLCTYRQGGERAFIRCVMLRGPVLISA
jgi:antirestriction protein ArdC